MKKFKSLIATFLAVAVLASGGACSPEGDSNYSGYDESLRVEDTRDISDEEYSFLNVVGTDNYGRSIVTVDGKRKSDLYVGMFYFLTLGQHSNHAGIYDISKITVDGTDLDAFQVNSTASPLGKAHFWGEPVWGYYNSTDPWVIRKQIELLTMAGIDFIVLDTSNGVLYQAVTDVLFPILKEYSDQGWNVPKVMYYLQANSADNSTYMNSLETVYNYFYKSGEYSDLWFCPNGKPMITRHELATDTVLQQTKLPDDSEKSYYDFIDFEIDVPLEFFGGRTAYQVSQDAFRCHISQFKSRYRIWLLGTDDKPVTKASQFPKYNPRYYGLYYSAVGKDKIKTDFYENIVLLKDQKPGIFPSSSAVPSDVSDYSPHPTVFHAIIAVIFLCILTGTVVLILRLRKKKKAQRNPTTEK